MNANAMVATLFDALARGILAKEGVQSFPLNQAGATHEAIELRRVTSSIAPVQ